MSSVTIESEVMALSGLCDIAAERVLMRRARNQALRRRPVLPCMKGLSVGAWRAPLRSGQLPEVPDLMRC